MRHRVNANKQLRRNEAMTDPLLIELRGSWEVASERSDEVFARFYDLLFARAPELSALFQGTDMAVQGSKLAAAIALVVREAEHPGQLAPIFQDLGRRHASYGVKAEDYEVVGGALIDALAEALGAQFSPAAQLA